MFFFGIVQVGNLEDDATFGADVLALVARGSAGLLADLAVLASGSWVLDLGSIAQVAKAAESLAVGGGVEGEVPLADGHTLREALSSSGNDGRGGIKLRDGRDSGGQSQESDDKLHHDDCRFKLAWC